MTFPSSAILGKFPFHPWNHRDSHRENRTGNKRFCKKFTELGKFHTVENPCWICSLGFIPGFSPWFWVEMMENQRKTS